MPIEGFDYKEFAKNLAEQAGQVIPADISDPDKQYIVNIVYNFSYMAGEALFNDANLNFNSQQAMLVTQFIGEWSFHKSIDVIRSGIDAQFRDGIMQKIAFTVFEIAKQAILKNMTQDDTINIVEFHVKKAYVEALQELKNKGVINEEQCSNAEKLSNIDDMAQQVQEQAAAAASGGGGDVSHADLRRGGLAGAGSGISARKAQAPALDGAGRSSRRSDGALSGAAHTGRRGLSADHRGAAGGGTPPEKRDGAPVCRYDRLLYGVGAPD